MAWPRHGLRRIKRNLPSPDGAGLNAKGLNTSISSPLNLRVTSSIKKAYSSANDQCNCFYSCFVDQHSSSTEKKRYGKKGGFVASKHQEISISSAPERKHMFCNKLPIFLIAKETNQILGKAFLEQSKKQVMADLPSFPIKRKISRFS